MNANMRAVADDYASRGFAAVVPDLFWRQRPGVQLDPSNPGDRELAARFMNGLDLDLALSDARSAARHCSAVAGAGGPVAAVGYCLGGKLAYLLSTMNGIDVAVSYYGVGIHGVLGVAGAIACPLLLHIAEEDPLCPKEAQQSIKAAVSTQPLVQVYSYPGVGHAFARRGGASYDAAAAAFADRRTSEFIRTAMSAPL